MSLLELNDLQVDLPVSGQYRRILQGVTFSLAPGAALGLVGESGSGKSVTLKSIMRLLPVQARVRGEIVYQAQSVLTLRKRALRTLRAEHVAMVHQDPRTAINPVRTIGDFMTEGIGRGSDAWDRAASALAEVGIRDARRRFAQYPHQLSGGLLQRVMIAGSLIHHPKLVLADEPTTALDMTSQADVVAVLARLQAERHLGLVFVTHDLDLAAAVTDTLAVMYAGVIVEYGPTARIQDRPLHPYTAALLASRPRLDRRTRLQTIPGRPVAAYETGTGCVFATRCPLATDRCRTERPALADHGGRLAACHRVGDSEFDDAVVRARKAATP
ncbi:oligopeptide/dipeptide ABC transporter ATP-binding protein [Actinoplanes lutulentus]|uniref:Oligopeptide/dipeptide ABC transporter ATP-binding protein n=1 Tax=Actinoplanes lutulentus TaxID=1287878 RepID=A0A327Z3I4_9ACTN|nr:ABC transporter ATP-binding protein [Actinoplanes lutulentus]MBB2946295.1 oligopeptide/dipeptide ABC transporter ATP-binding protein [Actinoplanes lutulentus]RAK28766.1 oligopeptide/dipeptide ABC transporter ATP-binding protein [Actinoplanes lutulentus]